MTKLSLSSCLAFLLVSSMKVFMREQISLGAMVTLSVTQAPRSILPMGSETEKMLRMMSLNQSIIVAPCTFSFSGYFQKARVFPSRTTQRRCQAPKPETSSNMVMKPLLET